jgi:hypothetical protein
MRKLQFASSSFSLGSVRLLVALVGFASPSMALGSVYIDTLQGKANLSNVGVIYSFVHENVPAGTTVAIETYNLAVSQATAAWVDTVVHVFDHDTKDHIGSNDDCGWEYRSCLTLQPTSTARSFVIYVHAWNTNTHGAAELRISHNGTSIVEIEPFTFGGVRAYTDIQMPTDSYLFTTVHVPPPHGARLFALQWTESVLAFGDNDGQGGFPDFHIPAPLGYGGSFVVGAYGGIVYGEPNADLAGVTLHWDANVNYMMPYQKKVEDTAYGILRAAAQALDDRWHTAFEQAFSGRIGFATANNIRSQILDGARFPVQLQFVDPSVFASTEALGAYAPNKIFLSSALTDQYMAANIFIEEIGHYFDDVYGGPGDAPGDEGHIFWSYIVGEQLSPSELADLLALDDSGTICVGGQCYSVEFLGLPTWLKRFASSVWSGIKTGGSWVWSGATTVAGALQTAAGQTWNGSQVLGGWIQQGALVAAEKYVELCKRTGLSAINAIKGGVDAIHDLGLGIYDGGKIMAEGVAELSRGNLGLRAFG